MNQNSNKKEDKPLDPFFAKVRDQVKQVGANAKLRILLATILENQVGLLSQDEIAVNISILSEQYKALCHLIGVQPNLSKDDNGQTGQLCSESEITGESGIPLHEEGNESGEDRPGNDAMEQ